MKETRRFLVSREEKKDNPCSEVSMTTVTSLTELFVWVLVKSSEITSEYTYIRVCVVFFSVCEYAGIPAHVNCL